MRKLTRFRLLAVSTLAATLSLTGLDPAAAARAESPIKALKRTNTRINRLLRQQEHSKAGRSERLQNDIKRAINRFLDFRELARLALASHWDQRTPAERDEFVSILRQLIEKNYIKQLRSNVDYEIDYRDQSVKGSAAHVTTAIKVTKDGRPEEVVIEYKMRRVKGGWMVYDVITDDVSIVRNYRSQFNRIIRKKSYSKLVEKMRSKLRSMSQQS